MDLTDTIIPKSEQLDAVDLLDGARVFTITGASKGNTEQPVNIALAEFNRPWRPGKSMRRVLVAAWGADASKYAGRRVELYCDSTVRFGTELVGGTRIRRMSNIDKKLLVPLIVTRGKSAIYTVDPLPDAPKPSTRQPLPSRIDVDECTDTDQLSTWAEASEGERKSYIDARIAALAPDPHAADIAMLNAENEAQE